MLRGRVVALIVAGLIVAACDGSTPSPKPPPTVPAAKPIPEAGQCLAKEVPDFDDFAPDLDSLVDCTEPHIYEVTAVVDVPAAMVKGKTPKELVTLRNKLAKLDDDDDGEDKDRRQYHAQASDQCGPAHATAAGLSKLELNGKSATDASLDVIFRDADQWLNVLDAGNWAKGNTKFLCLIRFREARTGRQDGERFPHPVTVRSQSLDPVEQSFLTEDFPLRHRLCVNLDARGTSTPVACTKQHQGEMMLGFNARTVLGTRFVESIGLDKPSKKQTQRLNQPCVDALPTFLGPDHDDDLTAIAERGRGGWVAQGDFYPTWCIVVSRDSQFDLPEGSLIGGDATKVDLVPAGQSQVSWLRSR